MSKIIGTALLGVVVAVVVSAGLASAGKKTEKLDQVSETGRGHVGFVIGGTASPTKKFQVKVTSKPRGVEVVAEGQMLCAPKKGDTAKTEQVGVTRDTPFKFTIKPTIKRNRFCDLTMPVDANGLEQRTTVTGKVFHKR